MTDYQKRLDEWWEESVWLLSLLRNGKVDNYVTYAVFFAMLRGLVGAGAMTINDFEDLDPIIIGALIEDSINIAQKLYDETNG